MQKLETARIIAVNKNNYKVSYAQHEMAAELSGRFLFTAESSVDFPTVGDWVSIQCFDSLGIIHNVVPRESLLKRKDPGKAVQFQLIAANIDYAFIMQDASDLNLNRLERYLVMVNESNIKPIIVLNKIDLVSKISDKVKRLSKKHLVLPISNITGEGIPALQEQLHPEKTYCLMGSSGVGKTTLLNNLIGEQKFETNEVREKDNKGRHTTTRRQLIELDNGAIIIDTPGMRELGNFDVDNGLDETFDEITALSDQCRFKDCTHIHEKGCAVREAVNQGTINDDRYDNFLKIRKESEFYEMSYLEKRKKDKAFGKMIKNYKKQT